MISNKNHCFLLHTWPEDSEVREIKDVTVKHLKLKSAIVMGANIEDSGQINCYVDVNQHDIHELHKLVFDSGSLKKVHENLVRPTCTKCHLRAVVIMQIEVHGDCVVTLEKCSSFDCRSARDETQPGKPKTLSLKRVVARQRSSMSQARLLYEATSNDRYGVDPITILRIDQGLVLQIVEKNELIVFSSWSSILNAPVYPTRPDLTAICAGTPYDPTKLKFATFWLDDLKFGFFTQNNLVLIPGQNKIKVLPHLESGRCWSPCPLDGNRFAVIRADNDKKSHIIMFSRDLLEMSRLEASKEDRFYEARGYYSDETYTEREYYFNSLKKVSKDLLVVFGVSNHFHLVFAGKHKLQLLKDELKLTTKEVGHVLEINHKKREFIVKGGKSEDLNVVKVSFK